MLLKAYNSLNVSIRPKCVQLCRHSNLKYFHATTRVSSSSRDFNEEDWASVRLGKEDSAEGVMKKRLDEAKQWEQRQLSDDDSKLLNRLLGIENDMIELEKESKTTVSKSKSIRSMPKLEQQKGNELKGFLEMNPFICSGCGTPFQSKHDTDPGFLPKEKFQEHRIRAENIKLQQEAIRILDIAGIDIDSETAVETLKQANIPTDVIEGVRNVGRMTQRKPTFESEFSPKEKFREHHIISPENVKLQQDAIRILEIAGIIDMDSKAAVETLTKAKIPIDVIEAVRNIDKMTPRKRPSFGKRVSVQTSDIDNENAVNDQGEKDKDVGSVCICQRCFRLQQYNQIEQSLRPGWSNHELLTADRFQELLKTIKESPAVVICIVDLFDLKGSIVKNLKEIAGSNPIVIACNKIDLLPKDISNDRITTWIYSELQNVCRLKSPRILEEEQRIQMQDEGRVRPRRVDSEAGILKRSNIHLVSCQTGQGMDKLITSVMAMANDNGEKVYVMGNANVGKSSFINYWIAGCSRSNGKQKRKSSNKAPSITVSNLPGTTLDFLKIKRPNGVQMIDTPGLINDSQLTARLTVDELKKVIPVKPITAVTLRVAEGKCVMIGGLAVVELFEGRPFFFTFFIANEVKLHPTDASKVIDIRNSGVGTLIDPPSTKERIAELGDFEEHIYDITGEGWIKSSEDIVISGLGWITITGSGSCRVKVSVPNGVAVGTRLALLPYESSHSTATFTGSRLTKKSRKPSSGDGKAYGWRA